VRYALLDRRYGLVDFGDGFLDVLVLAGLAALDVKSIDEELLEPGAEGLANEVLALQLGDFQLKLDR
jgi:hypothetical protein